MIILRDEKSIDLAVPGTQRTRTAGTGSHAGILLVLASQPSVALATCHPWHWRRLAFQNGLFGPSHPRAPAITS